MSLDHEDKSFAPTNKRVRVLEKSFAKHLDECKEQHELVKNSITKLAGEVGAVTDLFTGAKKLIWRATLAVAGVIATAAATILVQNFTTSHEVAAKADLAATTANYTRSEARRDRQELLSEIRNMKDAR